MRALPFLIPALVATAVTAFAQSESVPEVKRVSEITTLRVALDFTSTYRIERDALVGERMKMFSRLEIATTRNGEAREAPPSEAREDEAPAGRITLLPQGRVHLLDQNRLGPELDQAMSAAYSRSEQTGLPAFLAIPSSEFRSPYAGFIADVRKGMAFFTGMQEKPRADEADISNFTCHANEAGTVMTCRQTVKLTTYFGEEE